jgi:hypothetical protein
VYTLPDYGYEHEDHGGVVEEGRDHDGHGGHFESAHGSVRVPEDLGLIQMRGFNTDNSAYRGV